MGVGDDGHALADVGWDGRGCGDGGGGGSVMRGEGEEERRGEQGAVDRWVGGVEEMTIYSRLLIMVGLGKCADVGALPVVGVAGLGVDGN